jgi:hypothetical protein
MNAWGHIAPHGARPNGSGNNIFGCFVRGYFSGTYVQSDNAQFTGVGGASGTIATSLKNGKTITLLDACFAAPGDEAGTKIGAKTVAISTNDITCELTGSNMTTEHAGAALGTMNEPIVLFVTYVES